MSTQSVRSKTKKIREISLTHEVSQTASDQVEIVSHPSSSRRNELYDAPQFRNEWDNDVPFHVAQNIVHLRRYRRVSQQNLATAVGTSQSAIARIESGQENITLETLQRITVALNGRFYIALRPQEVWTRNSQTWWNSLCTLKGNWALAGVATQQNPETEDVCVWFQRPCATLIETGLLLEGETS